MHKTVLFLLLFLGVGTAFAQTSEEKKLLEAGPLIAPLPSLAQWSVDYTYSDAFQDGKDSAQVATYKAAAAHDPNLAKLLANPVFLSSLKHLRPKRILVTQTGKIRHEEKVMEGNSNIETWRIEGAEVDRVPNTTKLTVRITGDDPASNFIETSWISPKKFIGTRTENNRKCFVFKEDRYDDEHQFIGTAYAFIDSETRFPVGYRFQGTNVQYTMLPPPKAPLVAPPEFVAAATKSVENIQKGIPRFSPP